MDLSDFLAVIWRWKWLVLIIVALVTGYVLITSLRIGDSYSAEVTVVPGLPQIASATAAGINIEQAGDRIGATYSELVTSQPVLEKALDKADLNWDPHVLAGMISTDVPKNTPMVNVSVTDSEPKRAQVLANAVGDGFIEYIQEVSKSGTDQAKGIIQNELAEIEKQYAIVQPNGSAPDASAASALQDRRQSALKNYETLLQQQVNNADIRVSSYANTYSVVSAQRVQKIMIAFFISLAIAIATAFLAEGIRNSLSRQGQENLSKA